MTLSETIYAELHQMPTWAKFLLLEAYHCRTITQVEAVREALKEVLKVEYYRSWGAVSRVDLIHEMLYPVWRLDEHEPLLEELYIKLLGDI